MTAVTVTAVDPRTMDLKKITIDNQGKAYRVAHELVRDGFIEVKVYV